ncbi:hypothetical protein HUT19_33080 [Streptomyces sp. NA02950]|uniref:SAV_2336 N-terminal domain-related protein n=1 Tax=Streptomyces sp. NA02950 TaxID=2742137 RepID=UPI00158FE326|nr:SAV_2336 N-terminal domain-related protein [Streptomyces sp. NA02950]QKV95973.1 hypothetical protein HUT19_33080 [Streptomyces sp. NA02950]
MIRELAELLRLFGEAPEAEQLADALWLADRLGPPASPAGPARGSPAAVAGPDGGPQATEQPPWEAPAHAAPVAAPEEHWSGAGPGSRRVLYPPQTGPARGGAGSEQIRLRVPAALPRRASLARALRPLTRRVPSRDVTVLDEEATVEGIVDTAQWSPVLRPAPSRWLDLVLVVDDSVSMTVWRDTVREFLSVLGSVGAFRSVQHWLLPTEEIPSHGIVLRPPTVGPGERRGDRSPLEIVDPTGRRIVLVASDCVSPSWADGTLGRLLRTWGQSGPVALVQLLPRRMWEQSALSVHDVRLGTEAPGVPNARLAVTPLDSHRPAERAIVVPVLELDPRWLGPWAALVSGEITVWDTVATLVPESPVAVEAPGPALAADSVAATPEKLVRDFGKRASPAALRLASHLAGVPLSLPVMRLVQQAVCGDTRPSVLTEVLFTGLVTRASEDAADAADTAGHEVLSVPFDFRPGVREVLLGMARRTQVLQTLSLVTEWLFDRLQRSGTPTTDFTALLSGEATAVGAARSVQPFATVTAQALRHLSGQYETLARQLEEPAPAEARGTPSAVTGPVAGTKTPAVSGAVPPVGALLERDELLAEVHAGAFGGRGAGLVLTAREGGGATATAARYVALYGQAYDHVAWVTAGRPTTGPELPALLRTTGGQDAATWLLVVDGARPEDLPAPLPDGPGTVLVTSVESDWPNGFVPRPVPSFKRATSIRFLLDRVPGLAAPVALRIAARLDDVPLALTMAAGLLPRLVPDALLTALGADAAPGARPAAPLDDPVAEVCALAQDQAVRDCPAAAPLLDLCAVLARGPVPTGFFSRALPRTYGAALAALTDTALVTAADDGAAVFLASVVGRVRRERMDPVDVRAAERLARAAFTSWHAAVASALAGDGDGLLGLTRHLEPMGALGDDDPAVREAVRDQVRLLADCGDVPGALAWGALALERLRARVGADGPGTAELALLLARMAAEAAKDEGPHRS